MVNKEEIKLQNDCSEGIYLSDNQAFMLWTGNKSLIVKSVLYENSVGKLYYIVGNNEAYCVIKIKDVKIIDLNEFKNLNGLHRITEQERKLWWPDKEKLFVYNFELVHVFETPILADTFNSKNGEFIGEVNLLSDISNREKELIKKILVYEPSKESLLNLKKDFRILSSWNLLKDKNNFPFDEEKINKVLKSIITELSFNRNIKVDISKLNLLNMN